MPRVSKLVAKSLLACLWGTFGMIVHYHMSRASCEGKKKKVMQDRREDVQVEQGQGFKGQPAEDQAPCMSVFFRFEMS